MRANTRPIRPHVFDQDDIAHLRRHLGMPDMPYVDFSARRECADALKRWPLLGEIAAIAAERAALHDA